MKNFLLKTWLTMLCLLVGVGTLWAQEAIYTLSFEKLTSGTNYNSYTGSHDITCANIGWTVFGNQSVTEALRVGGKNTTNTNRTITSKSPLSSDKISKVSIRHNGYGNGSSSSITINSVTVEGSLSSDFSNSKTKTITSPSVEAPGSIDFALDEDYWLPNSYFRITVNYVISGSNNCYLTIRNIAFFKAVAAESSTYNINVDNNINGGTISTSPTSAEAGSEITLTATPDEGYEFGSWNVTNASTNENITVTDNKFTMPAANVNVSATFNTVGGGSEDEYIHDVLTNADLAATGTAYADFSNVKKNTAVYGGQSAKNNGIQLRATNPSGIVSTTSGGNIKTITVTWNSNTTSGRTIDVYGSNTAYSSAADLYDNSKRGTKLGSIVMGTSTSITVTGDYAYVGIRSNSGALNIDKIDFAWEESGDEKEPLTITFGDLGYKSWGKSESFSGSTYDELSQTKDNVEFIYKRNESSAYANTSSIRFYKNNELTFTAPEGYYIISIEWTGSGFKDDVTTDEETCTSSTSALSWEGCASSITFTRPDDASSYITLSSVTVTLQDSSIPVKTLSSITVKTAPTKVVYTEGEKFDPTGLIITADYGTDGTEDVAYAGNEGKFTFNPALTAPLATTNATVTITYGSKTTEQIITVNELPKYTVTFDAQAGSCDTESLTESVSGEGITLPSATCYDKEWTFAGWATAACNETTTAPTLYKAGATYKPTTDITLYAVYMTGVPEGETAFNRVTDISELTDGKKVVVVSNATNYALTLTAGDTNKYTNSSSISMSDNGKIWTLTKQENEYVFMNNASTPKTMSTNGVPGTSTTNIAFIGDLGASNGSYKYANWTITPSSIDGCFVITNTLITENGTAALTVGKVSNKTQWGVLNVNDVNGSRDASVFAMRIYAEGPSISATYNSNPIEYFNLTISSAGYATYYNAFAYKMPENVVGKIMVYEDGVVKSKLVYEAGDVVPVETPLLLKGNPATYTLVKTTEEATKSAEGNLLRGSHESKITTGGSEQAKYYKFSNGDNGYGWYYGSKDNTTGAPFMNGAHKAYLVVEPDQSMSTRFIAIDSEGVLTDIEGINVDDTNGNVYDLQGRRVQRAGNGMYIKNGKKVIF